MSKPNAREFIERSRRLCRRFASDATGMLAVQFVLLATPLIMLSIFAVDYNNVVRVREVLQSAADAAALGAVSYKSAGYNAAAAQTGTGPASVPEGAADALSLFNNNIAGGHIAKSVSSVTPTAAVTRSGMTLTSTVSATAKVPATIGALIGGDGNWTLTVNSTGSNTLPKYLDYYLLIDVSGSMGLPSTNAEQSRLAAVNPDNRSDYPNGCTFACHFSGYSGFTLSRNGGNNANPQVATCATAGTSACIQLRTDAVGSAVQQLIQTAQANSSIANQYRIGLYPFIANLKSYFPLTSNLSLPASNSASLAYAANRLSTQLDTGADATLGSGGTHFDTALTQLNQLITSVGSGSTAATPQPFVFMITDGAQNNQYYWNGSWWGNNSPTTLDPSYCATLKNRGIIVGVLYIPYLPIQNPTSFGNNEDYYANANIPYISPALQKCASSGFFFAANAPADITNALNLMFKQSLYASRITR